MIQFTLKCEHDHRFESWFQSAAAFDKLKAAGMVTCAACGSSHVDKAVMAPRVNDSKSKGNPPAKADLAQADPTTQAMADMRRKVEENSEYVGNNFVQEARDIHDGLAPERSIHGEARVEDAKKLIEDGVPIAPLPFAIGQKTN